MDRDVRNSYALSGAMVGAGAGMAAAPYAANRGKGALVRRQMRRAMGTQGGLTAEGKPVNPWALSGKRGGRQIDEHGAVSRRPSARAQAAHRYRAAAKPFEARLAKPAVSGKKGLGLKVAGAVLGVGGLEGLGQTAVAHGSRVRQSKVRKDDLLTLASPQYGVGIPATRLTPINPLAMSASSSIMADFMAGASGKRLSRGKRKQLRRGAYGFAGAGGLLYSPLGYGVRQA